MALQVSTAKREFIIKKGKAKDNLVLRDPHPDMTPQEVQQYYKGRYPELASASIEGPKMEENKAVYTFNSVLGDKG